MDTPRRNYTYLTVTLAGALFLVYAGTMLIPHAAGIGPFDSRSIQHLVGFWGLAIIVQGIVAGCYSREAYVVHALVLGGTVLAGWMSLAFHNFLPLTRNDYALAGIITIFGTPYLAAGLIIAGRLKTENRALIQMAGLSFCLCISLACELFIQPFVSVYGGPPRHAIQWGQVAGDLIGIALAYGTLWGFALRSSRPVMGTPGMQMAP